MQKHPRQVRPRHLIPALFVSGLIVLLALSILVPQARLLLALALASYGAASLTASVVAIRRAGIRLIPLVMLVYLVLHVAYGVGFLVGLVHFARRPLPSGQAAGD
jgi:hypothetical protein